MARSAVIRLAAFVLVIAGSFGTAYGLGRKLPGNPESKPHTHATAKADPVPPGFAADGYVLVTDADQTSTSALALHVNGPDDQPVTEYTEAHGSKLHVVLVRPDLVGFQHVHPAIGADGSFIVPIDQPGKWHVVVEAQPAGAAAPVVLATNVDDEVQVDAVSLPAPDDEVSVDGLTVTRQGVNFTVTASDGSAAEGLEPYLGQPAHLIAIRQGDLAYTHLHPSASTGSMTSMLMFDGALPAGTYRLFLQFGHRGDVLTVSFTVVQP
jgi:hypothetical protein